MGMKGGHLQAACMQGRILLNGLLKCRSTLLTSSQPSGT